MIGEKMYKNHREFNYKAQEKKEYLAQKKKESIEKYKQMVARNPYRREAK